MWGTSLRGITYSVRSYLPVCDRSRMAANAQWRVLQSVPKYLLHSVEGILQRMGAASGILCADPIKGKAKLPYPCVVSRSGVSNRGRTRFDFWKTSYDIAAASALMPLSLGACGQCNRQDVRGE